ncbi:two-component sensor histidine kinase [Paenibacillus baekrokdamisoli]|uniref:histidine kinase n=1 Tax=Paenibacillus baekrokdamisoli TaxID=1712516 RepID=A0A3G9J2E3_9BACL|nr:histidine kinase [Paenibacillus baekrokdamisoli]MBB3069172.1 two-component system sensor histidine kinase YesM [Paenibacillus baekrokdamisoli]BBH18853.1 two-component sensor histidine kinase [Paenibacillus baekrokdamisoli]
MWRKMRISNVPIFPKLVITFLVITIPLFALSLVLNELGKQEVKNQISNSITTTIHYYFLSLEKELERIIRTQQEFINDDDLMQLSNEISIMSDYKRTKAINDLKKKLKSLKDSSIYIKDITVYIPSINGTVSTSNALDTPSTREEAEAIAKATYTSGIPITSWQHRLYLNLTYPNNLMKRDGQIKPPQFIQNIELSMEALTNALNSFPQDGGAILFNDNWVIANDKYPEPLAEIRQKLDETIQQSAVIKKQINVGKEKYIVIYDQSLFLDASLLFYFPEDIIVGQLKTYGTWFWLLVCSSIIIVILFSYGIYLLIHRPIQILIRRFRNVEEGNFNAALPTTRQDEFGYIHNRFERTVQNLKTLIDELYVQKIRLQQSELKQLQMQITPHFLYNSFFILHRLIKNDENETAELVSKNLGDYFQYITRNGLEEVPLEEEVNHVRSYVEIQNIRFSNRIIVEFEPLPERFRDLMIPRLILQPLVENAYEHGLSDIVTEGRLKVGFTAEENKLFFSVEDNGSGLTEERMAGMIRKLSFEYEGETTGLINIQRRLKLRYGERGGLEIMHGASGGLLVRIYIPNDKGE